MKKYKLILPLAFSLILGSFTATAQKKDGGSQKEKPTKEKSDKVGVSGGKSTNGEGGKACVDRGRASICVEKSGYNPSKGWGGSIGYRW